MSIIISDSAPTHQTIKIKHIVLIVGSQRALTADELFLNFTGFQQAFM